MTFLCYLSGFVTSNVPLSVLHKHVPKTVLKRQCRPVHSHSLASTVALAQFELALLLQLLTRGSLEKTTGGHAWLLPKSPTVQGL